MIKWRAGEPSILQYCGPNRAGCANMTRTLMMRWCVGVSVLPWLSSFAVGDLVAPKNSAPFFDPIRRAIRNVYIPHNAGHK